MERLDRILSAVRRCAGGAMDLLLPDICAGCRSEDATEQGLCHTCSMELLSLVAAPYCRRCGAGLGPNVPEDYPSCRACPEPLPRYESVVRLGSYAEPLRSAVRELKYHRVETLRRQLGKMLAAAVAARSERRPDVVLCVPMHWRRRLARGYDHSLVLAKAVAGELQLPVGDELIRVRHTPPQAHLPRTARIHNVRDAFAVRHARSLQGAGVLLVDDVTTTGATANEAARTLLAAGASAVTLAVVAKAEPPPAYAEHRPQQP